MALRKLGTRPSDAPPFDLAPVVGEEPRSTGVMRKPSGCQACAYRTTGTGFCPDWYPNGARIAFLLEAPGEDEILWHTPLKGKAGQFWFSKLIAPFGLTRDDCLIANTIRCKCPGNQYPTGRLRGHAEELCRQYDAFHGAENGQLLPGGIVKFNPDAFVIAMHPAALLRSSAATRLVKRAVERGVNLQKAGYRPCVLMGDKAMNLVAPWAAGGVKKWNCHFWLSTGWPFNNSGILFS